MFTLWHGKLSIPGYSSRSPVRTLKQAPCHGQRTVWLVRAPAHRNTVSQMNCTTAVRGELLWMQTHIKNRPYDRSHTYLYLAGHHSVCIGCRWRWTCPHSVLVIRCDVQLLPPSSCRNTETHILRFIMQTYIVLLCYWNVKCMFCTTSLVLVFGLGGFWFVRLKVLTTQIA